MAMQVDVRWNNVASDPEVEQNLLRRLDFALARQSERISWVRVSLSDENGPRGGVDKLCRISVQLKQGPLVVIDERDHALQAAVSLAADRISHAVRRHLARMRDHAAQPHPLAH